MAAQQEVEFTDLGEEVVVCLFGFKALHFLVDSFILLQFL